MKLTIKQLYDTTKEQNLAVLAKDGLPFNTVTATTPDPYPHGDVYFFRHEDSDREWLDFQQFFEICVPSVCWGDMVAGECEIMEVDGIRFMGIDIHNNDLEKLEIGA